MSWLLDSLTVCIKPAEERGYTEKKGSALDVMGFLPHPKTVLSNGKAKLYYLMPLEEKPRALHQYGISFAET